MIFDRLRSLPTSGSIVIPRTAGIGATPPLAHPTGRAGIHPTLPRRRCGAMSASATVSSPVTVMGC
jgi:hypothetical protein